MKIGRNEPCPCGSGEKYKKCCKSLKTLLGKDKPETQLAPGVGPQEALLADLLGGYVDHELTRYDLLNIARNDELDTPEERQLLKELDQSAIKFEKTLAQYDEQYGLPESSEEDFEKKDEPYDGFQTEAYYDGLEAQYEEAKNEGLFMILPVLRLDEQHSEKSLVDAVSYYIQNDGDIKEDAPMGILNKYEQRMVKKGGFRPKLWAMLLAGKFSEAIQEKKAFVKHSNKFSFPPEIY